MAVTYAIHVEIPPADKAPLDYWKNLAGQLLRVAIASRSARPNQQIFYEHIPGAPARVVARCNVQAVRAFKSPAEVIASAAANV